MADKAQVESLLVTLGTLSIEVRDQLAELQSHMTKTLTPICLKNSSKA